MNAARKIQLMEAGLTKAADQLGDITPRVLEHFYHRYPEAKDLFNTLSLGKSNDMEGEMVTQTIYSLLGVLEKPAEIRIMIQEQAPHHHYLQVTPEMFNGFIDSTVDVIVDTLSNEDSENIAIINEARQALKFMAATH